MFSQTIYKSIFTLCLFIGMFFVIPKVSACTGVCTANYYLNELKNDQGFIQQLAKYDLLVLTADQIKDRGAVIHAVKNLNPDIIILAYVPSQSFNYQYWNNNYSLFGKLRPISDNWWLKDPQGQIISQWTGLHNINMSEEWGRHLVDFVNKNIVDLYGVDGVFFDMVSESISWINNGNIDLDNDGVRDTPQFADNLWRQRTQYLLQYAKDNIQTKYILINGSDYSTYQPLVNGRMLENFMAPWENSKNWTYLMNGWKKNKKNNLKPQLTIINANSNNSGFSDNYSHVRFTLISSLLEDGGYFAYDYGDRNHGQTWWYDEYNVNLGSPTGAPQSLSNYSTYTADVWRRDFTNGLVILNSTSEKKTVDLGGDYEKIKGTQDNKINNGAIVSQTVIDGYDGLLLLKTVSTLEDVLFRNGDFVRFFGARGNRLRNGFFIFEGGYQGGDKIAHTDLNGNGVRDLVVISGTKLMGWRDDGQVLFRIFPYTANYKGELRAAVGDINGDDVKEIIVAPSAGYNFPLKVYSYYGELIKDNFFPFGDKYKGGYSLALNVSLYNNLVIAKQTQESLVSIFDLNYKMARQWLAFGKSAKFGANVALGDVNGDGADEVIVGAGAGSKPLIRIFDKAGKQLFNEFTAYQTLSLPGIEVLSVDVNYDGVDDIVSMGNGL